MVKEEAENKLKLLCSFSSKLWNEVNYAHITFEISEKAVREEWSLIPKRPLGDLVAGIDIGINNLMALYAENSLTKLVNRRPLKAISHYWQRMIAGYQSNLNRHGLKASRRLRKMYSGGEGK